MTTILILLLFHIIFVNCTSKIAIIGSGIGGTHTAYLLSNSNINSEIHIYEQSNFSGGRVNTEEFEGKVFELGAEFFINDNKILVELIQELKLTKYEKNIDDKSLGLWSGSEQLDFYLGNSLLINLPKLIYRYGLSMYYAKRQMATQLENFIKIYPELEKGKFFRDLKSLLEFMNLKDMIHIKFEDYLAQEGFYRQFMDELLNAVLGSIYNQNIQVNSFTGLITFAALFNKSMGIKEGNNQLVVQMLQRLQKNNSFKLNLNSKVDIIEKTSNGKYIAKTNSGMTNKYDIIIIAAPLLKTDIQFVNVNTSKNVQPKKYVNTHVFVVNSELKYEKFGLRSKADIPFAIFSYQKNITNISEFKKLGENLFKVQAETKVDELELSKYFHNPKIVLYKDWIYAYPKLDVVNEEELPDFVIDENLYHINAIEAAGSAMEMILISSKNIVNLVLENSRMKSSTKESKPQNEEL